MISEDRLELALKDGIDRVGARTAWAIPAGILLSCVIAIVTSNTHDSLGIPAAVWQATFYLVAVASFIWLAFALVKCRPFSSRDFIELIRGASSKFTDASVEQTQAPAPLDSLQRISGGGALISEDQRAVISRVSRRPNLARAVRDAASGPKPLAGIKPLSQALQCRYCGFGLLITPGQPTHCPNCKSWN